MKLLELSNASFSFGDKVIFKNLTFSLHSGEVCAILGLMGIIKTKTAKPIINAGFSYLPQNFTLVFDFKVLDIVLMGRASQIGIFGSPSKKDIQIATEALEYLGILNLQNEIFTRGYLADKGSWYFSLGLLPQKAI